MSSFFRLATWTSNYHTRKRGHRHVGYEERRSHDLHYRVEICKRILAFDERPLRRKLLAPALPLFGGRLSVPFKPNQVKSS